MPRTSLPTQAGSESLREQLDAHTMSGELVQPLERGRVRCVACGQARTNSSVSRLTRGSPSNDAILISASPGALWPEISEGKSSKK